MLPWSTKPAPATNEFVHVDNTGNSSSDKSGSPNTTKAKTNGSGQRARGGSQANATSGNTNSNSASGWQTAIIRLTDPSTPEDLGAVRRFGEEVRAAGTTGARAAVEILRARILDKSATTEARTRAIGIARILGQRSVSGGDAQKFLAAPAFVNTLKQAASNPNIRNSLKTWASQIRIGDPNDATILTSITGLDEHLAQANETVTQSPEASRRPPLNPTASSSFTGRTADEDPEDDVRSSVRTHVTGNRTAGEPIAAPVGQGVREFPSSSIQGIPPQMVPPALGSRPSFGNSRPNWPDEDDGVQSDTHSTRSRRTTSKGAFGGTVPSMDGGREARDRLNDRSTRRGRASRTSSLVDGTLSEAEEPSPRGRHPGPAMPATIPEDPRMQYGQRVPAPMQQRARSRHPSVSPGRNGFRSRSPSPASPATTGRSRATSRVRAQSRRRATNSGTDPAAVLVNLAGVQFVRVIQEFYATNSSELTLREGEVLAVIRQEEGGRYWLGHCQGQVGRFPAHVVEILSHQSRNSEAAQEEKTAELLRRAREIDDFMDQLHDFDITRYCITEDRDIQGDLAGLMTLRNEVVRHLDETTTGLGRLKAMLNRIKEAQRIHDRMIDSRIASYTARSSLHDNTPRAHYQELPPNSMQYSAYDMAQYMRRTAVPQQIEQPPPPAPSQSPPASMRPPTYNTNPAAALRYRQAQEMGYAPRPARSRTYSYTPAGAAQPPRRMDDEQSSAYISSEPTTPGESVGVPPPAANGTAQYAFPSAPQQQGVPLETGHTPRRDRF
ncbi:SH3 domain protein [Ceratobasidium sp. AG-Ba]|nr:SH3 domain protein [Ceratobasidium sp. AG-Ba]QRW14544.1 SH3 domain protein [Ceratobasidium sp. AG-Ba]